MISNGLIGSFLSQVVFVVSSLITSEQGPNESFQVPLEPLKNTGKTPKSSVPVLSAQKPWFSQGFSHFLPIALAFLPIHACPCLQVLRRLVRCLGPW
jgi:hypothetical protein